MCRTGSQRLVPSTRSLSRVPLPIGTCADPSLHASAHVIHWLQSKTVSNSLRVCPASVRLVKSVLRGGTRVLGQCVPRARAEDYLLMMPRTGSAPTDSQTTIFIHVGYPSRCTPTDRGAASFCGHYYSALRLESPHVPAQRMPAPQHAQLQVDAAG
jgi:hypothetical protein